MNGQYGSVTVSAGSEVQIAVSFRNAQTDKNVAIHSGYFFTVYDFDNELKGGGVEEVTISGYMYYRMSNTSSVIVHEDGNHSGRFTSSVYGTEEDNPKNPRQLSPMELDKSVTFGFPPDSPGFTIKISVSPGFSARNFEFTGFSALPCPNQAQCSSMKCPNGYEYTDDPDQRLCEGAQCTYPSDLKTCCQKIEWVGGPASCVSMLCPSGFELKIMAKDLQCVGEICMDKDAPTCCKPSQSFSSMCGLENQVVITEIEKISVSDGGHLVAKVANVFPNSNQTIDLKVTFEGLKTGADSPNAPGIAGPLAQVGLPAVKLFTADFRFLDPATGDVMGDNMPLYFITLFGGHKKGHDAAQRHVKINAPPGGLVKLAIAEDSDVEVESNNSFILGSVGAKEESMLAIMNLFALDDTARKKGISMLLNTSKFRIEITPLTEVDHEYEDGEKQGLRPTVFMEMQNGQKLTPSQNLSVDVDFAKQVIDATLLFGGASSLTCQSHATCGNYVCPSGFTLRENYHSLVCKGEACTADDYPTCCDCDPQAAFVMTPNQVKIASLGAPMPGDGTKHGEILIKNVFPNMKKKVNLRVRAIGDYWAGNATLNTMHDQFLNINVRTSSEATFRFEFQTDHGEPVRLPFNFVFSVFDLDQQEDGGGQEWVTVSNFAWYVLSNTSAVISGTEGEELVFHSSSFGAYWNNPSNPLALTDEHLQSSVSFMMLKDIAKFNVTVKVTDGFNGRNVLFAGQTNLVCSKREVCADYHCPRGKQLAHHADTKHCAGEVCTKADEAKCCMEVEVTDVAPLAVHEGEASLKKKHNSSRSHSSRHHSHSHRL